MFRKDRWPFTPICLSEIVDRVTLAVIESGCCERLERPLTILDYDPEADGFSDRIESINEIQRYEGFCRLLRDGTCVNGGDIACKQADIAEARVCLRSYYKTGDPFRTFECHMGLLDMTYLIRIRDHPVALVFSGQYSPPEGTDHIEKNVQALGTGAYAHIQPMGSAREQLRAWAREVPPAPRDVRERLAREAMHIERIAQAEFEQGKRKWEQEFLDELRQGTVGDGIEDQHRLQSKLDDLLARIQRFCRCEYAVFFASKHEGDTVLAPLASQGVLPEVGRRLPHLNWKKAGLPVESFDVKAWTFAEGHPAALLGGVRGPNCERFDGASCIIPVSLGNRYRGALMLGPFAEPAILEQERWFLLEMVNVVGSYVLTVLEVLSLEQERRRWHSTATLLTHQLRTALTPITSRIGRAKHLIERGGRGVDPAKALDLLQRAEDLSLHVARSARETLAGHVVQLERDDLDLEPYPLSVLVANCAEGWVPEAEKRYRDLIVDKSVELLPEAQVDVARMTIALSNLIDNAIKYSFPGTKIYVRAGFESLGDADALRAVIEVDDLGDQVRDADRERIFEEGTRGLTQAKMGRLPGSGLGLWEARAVVEAHRGEIDVRCEPTSIRRRQGLAYRVVFSVKLPLDGTHAS